MTHKGLLSRRGEMMAKVNPRLTLLFINIGIALGMILGYRNYNVDKLSILAIGGVAFLVFNGMFFIIRKSEVDLPSSRLKKLNKWAVWPFIFFAGLMCLLEYFLGRK